MDIKTYLFDFDGTLVDSMPAYVSTMLKILDDNNINYDNDIMKVITPLGQKGTAKYYQTLGIDKTEDELIEMMSEYAIDAYTYSIPAKDNVIEVLKCLKKKGIDINVLTASPHITLDVCLKRLGIFDIFSNVWSCEDFDTTKSDPQIYVKAAEKMGVDVCDVLFFDDNLNAVKTAKSAGMKTCGVYDDSSKEYTDEIRAVTDYYINDFIELLDINTEE